MVVPDCKCSSVVENVPRSSINITYILMDVRNYVDFGILYEGNYENNPVKLHQNF